MNRFWIYSKSRPRTQKFSNIFAVLYGVVEKDPGASMLQVSARHFDTIVQWYEIIGTQKSTELVL